MHSIIIVGYGNIGKLEYNILKTLTPAIYDTNIEITKMNIIAKRYDLAVICVPTPLTSDGFCDISMVEQAINEVEAEVYLIKSTVSPGTTDKLGKKLNKRIVMSPEHSGTTKHCLDFDYDFTILGGKLADCQYVQQIYQEVHNAYHKFMIVEAEVAEMSKYMLNCYLAMKVTFCNEIANACKTQGVPYEKVRECFILDPRIEASHTFVYDEHPYWDSHCFNKDIPAFANQYGSKLLKTVLEINDDAKYRTR